MRTLQRIRNNWTVPHSHASDRICHVSFCRRRWGFECCVLRMHQGLVDLDCHTSWKFASHDLYISWPPGVFSVIDLRSAHPDAASRPRCHVPNPQSTLSLSLTHAHHCCDLPGVRQWPFVSTHPSLPTIRITIDEISRHTDRHAHVHCPITAKHKDHKTFKTVTN